MNESIDGVKPRKFIFYIASLNRSVGENSQSKWNNACTIRFANF
jgi:hypothetical protein